MPAASPKPPAAAPSHSSDQHHRSTWKRRSTGRIRLPMKTTHETGRAQSGQAALAQSKGIVEILAVVVTILLIVAVVVSFSGLTESVMPNDTTFCTIQREAECPGRSGFRRPAA